MEPLAERSADAVRPPAPSGLVTFVFTDGEGSTRLLRELGDAYINLFDHHHRVLRDAWRRHEGYEFFTEGDAFGVAFASVDQALAACLDAQWHLQNEPWPNGTRMPVRMGVHTGLAAPRAGDYIALAVHQTSRVVAAAHGDQIVVTADALASAGPEFRASARDLGRYRVRDFEDPVHLHEVSDSGLTSTFPALRVPPARLHNLARPAASFIGRDDDMARLEQLVEPGRVVSIVGPGGVGKTRLCTEFAFRAVDRWPDGVWFVDLAALDQGDLVVSATATALGIAPSETDTLPALLDHLSSRSTLLVFDNAEHVLENTARLIATINRRSPTNAVMVTSRSPLGPRGERVVRLNPLREEAAALLYLDRSKDAGAERLPRADDRDLLALCRRLDCLPLAVEMAAARSATYSAREIADALVARPDGLRAADPTLDERHRSVTALIEWSTQLLDDATREVLDRTSIFAASFSFQGARALFDSSWSDVQLDDALYELVRRSLLLADTSSGTRRYRMFELVRALTRAGRPPHDALRDAVHLAEWLVQELGPRRSKGYQWSVTAAAELDNIHAVARALLGSRDDLAAELMVIVSAYHDHCGLLVAGVDELQRFAALLPAASAPRVRLLAGLTWLYLMTYRLDEAAATLGEADRAAALATIDPSLEHELTLMRGELALREDRPDDALGALTALLHQDLPVHQRTLLWTIIATSRQLLGDFAGDVDASRYVVECTRASGDTLLLAAALSNLADSYLALGDSASAAMTQLGALELGEQLGSLKQVTFSMLLAAQCAGAAGQFREALWLQRRADLLLDELGIVLYPPDRDSADRVAAAAAEVLGSDIAQQIDTAARKAPVEVVVARTRAALQRAASAPGNLNPSIATKEIQHGP